ncbi:MAG: DUF1573 domain-containing protein [Deltaproteobacteria bacterium]|nr:DUF1573 domain-containing protein [Deltaproteobacteria bacterium]
MAYFDRAVLPGGEGKITLKLNTKGYEGKVRKTASVYTNDPDNPRESLTLEVIVKTPITVSPKSVYIRGKVTETKTVSVDIKGEPTKPLKIEPGDFNLNQRLKYSIEELSPGEHYRIHFTSIPNTAENYRGRLLLKTNYPEKPQLSIPVRGHFTQ